MPLPVGQMTRLVPVRQVAAVAIAVIATITVGAFVARGVAPMARHTLSHITYLFPSSGGLTSDTVWVRETYSREIWIRPDGSGQISEHFDPPSFWTTAEHDQWLALGSPVRDGINEIFPLGGLTYLSAQDLTNRLRDLIASHAGPGERLHAAGAVLTETVPQADFVQSVIDAMSSLAGIAVEHIASTLELSGRSTDTLGTRVTLSFDLERHTFLGETQVATNSASGLDLPPPIVMLDRSVMVSDSTAWVP